MITILKTIAAGYLIAMICTLYLLARSWMTIRSNLSGQLALQSKVGIRWLGFLIVSSGVSLAWSLVGGGIHQLLQNDILFMEFSFVLATGVTMIISLLHMQNKLDVIALNFIVFLGSGALIPLLNQG